MDRVPLLGGGGEEEEEVRTHPAHPLASAERTPFKPIGPSRKEGKLVGDLEAHASDRIWMSRCVPREETELFPWAWNPRNIKLRGDRESLLLSIGFKFDPRDATWNEMRALKALEGNQVQNETVSMDEDISGNGGKIEG